MNYYEHHIGDYAEATGHLSFVEDAAYSRMIRKYYATERPLPADVKAVQRLVGARSKEEREAVETVLNEFFELKADGWHQARCDQVIAAYAETIPDREARKENDRERQRRARERRKALFEALRKHDIVPPYDTKTPDLELMLSRVTSHPVTRDVTPPVTRDNTATQTPIPSTQYPVEDQDHASPSSTAAPSTDLLGSTGSAPADLRAHRAQRLAQITDEAIETFNASPLVKPNGGLLATVSPKVGREKRQQQVARFLRTAKAICQESYDSQTITRQFLEDYWASCAADEHKSGRRGGGKDHPDWLPTFEYLTREKTMLEVYDRVNAEAVA